MSEELKKMQSIIDDFCIEIKTDFTIDQLLDRMKHDKLIINPDNNSQNVKEALEEINKEIVFSESITQNNEYPKQARLIYSGFIVTLNKIKAILEGGK